MLASAQGELCETLCSFCAAAARMKGGMQRRRKGSAAWGVAEEMEGEGGPVGHALCCLGMAAGGEGMSLDHCPLLLLLGQQQGVVLWVEPELAIAWAKVPTYH